jgi:hypothetical protein
MRVAPNASRIADCRSKIRLVGDRNMPFEMLIIFGARLLDHRVLDPPPTARCVPGRIEGIRIVDREDNLYEPIVLDHPPALDDMDAPAYPDFK